MKYSPTEFVKNTDTFCYGTFWSVLPINIDSYLFFCSADSHENQKKLSDNFTNKSRNRMEFCNYPVISRGCENGMFFAKVLFVGI